MALRHPFHDIREEFYHNDVECPEGQKIKQEHHKHGRGGKRLCEICKRLNAPKNSNADTLQGRWTSNWKR